MKPTYFWSGSNRPGEIEALAKHGRSIGVAVNALDKKGRGMAAILALGAPELCRVVVNVAQASGGRPILMLCRDRDQLPTGDTPVTVSGAGRFVLGFRKIAVNVARSLAGGANELAGLLRGIFGDDAGARGKGHKVVLALTRDEGWELSNAELGQIKANGSRCFVDSGAFGEVKLNAFHKCGDAKACRAGTCAGNGNLLFPNVAPFTFVDVKPIDDAEWTKRLDAYERIATALGSRCFLVAPDKVGDQAETLRRLARYADRVRSLRAMGANIIVPIQRGEMAGADFDRECSKILGFSDYLRGIPSKKAAATVEEIGALSASLPANARVHLLGLGVFGERYGEVMAAIDRDPELVTCDSVRIKALIGTKNGPNGGPRILTILTNKVKAFLGLAWKKRLNSTESDAVKFGALDDYFTNHSVGAAA